MRGFGREGVRNEWQVSLVHGRIESPVLDPPTCRTAMTCDGITALLRWRIAADSPRGLDSTSIEAPKVRHPPPFRNSCH